jgi:hypothetical protein
MNASNKGGESKLLAASDIDNQYQICSLPRSFSAAAFLFITIAGRAI